MEDTLRMRCRSCKQVFSDANTFTEAGWVETRISGLCEGCFDAAARVWEMSLGASDDEHDDEKSSK